MTKNEARREVPSALLTSRLILIVYQLIFKVALFAHYAIAVIVICPPVKPYCQSKVLYFSISLRAKSYLPVC